MRNRANDKVVSNKSTGNLQIYPQRHHHHPASKASKAGNELDTGWRILVLTPTISAVDILLI